MPAYFFGFFFPIVSCSLLRHLRNINAMGIRTTFFSWTIYLALAIAYAHALHPCSSGKECRKLINVESECDITTECRNANCVFSVSPSCDKTKDALERRIERVEKMAKDSKYSKDALEWGGEEYDDPILGQGKFNEQMCPGLKEYPDNVQLKVGKILAQAMKDIHGIIGPYVDKEFTIWKESYYMEGVRATDVPRNGIMMFRDAGVPMFESLEDAYEQFIGIANPRKLCTFVQWD